MPHDITLVKRKADEKTVTWIVQGKSVGGTRRLNGDSPDAQYTGWKWTALLLDEDGVEVERVNLKQTPPGANNLNSSPAVLAGDKVSLVLPLPGAEIMKKVEKVVIDYRGR